MTLEQKIRNSGETGVIGVQYRNDDNSIITVLDDFEGVLKCSIYLEDGHTVVRYLNSEAFYLTHDEAFIAEL